MRNRSVTEIMVMAFTAVVAVSILGFGGTIAVIEIRDPTVDTSAAANALFSVITAILGALLGIMAGRSEAFRTRPTEKPKKDDPDA